MKKNNSIHLSQIEKYFITVCQNALTFNLDPEESAEYFIKEMKKYFRMPDLDFKFNSLCALEVFLKKRFHKLNFCSENIVQVYGIFFGQAMVKSLGGIWLTDFYEDEPRVCFENNEFEAINPIEIARQFLFKNETSPTLLYYRMILDRIKRRVYYFNKEGLIPNFRLFVNLHTQLQWEMILSAHSDGEIAVRKNSTHIITLVQVRDFYVEIFVNMESCEDEYYNIFQASSKLLNPYLEKISLAEVGT